VAVDAVGNAFISTNPTGGAAAWTLTQLGGGGIEPLASVSCVAGPLCVAANAAGDVIASTDPTGGVSAWAYTPVDAPRLINAVSCPSASFCVGVDNQGFAFVGSGPPTVSADPAGAVGKTSATLSGSANPNGTMMLDCHFEYGTSTAYGATALCGPTPGAGTSAVPVSAQLAGLKPSTTYHFRLVASNLAGASAASDQTFKTSAGGGGGTGAPKLTALKLAPAAFRAAHSGPSTARAKTGTTVSYDDSAAAATTFTVKRAVPGVKRGHSCAKPSRKTRRGKRCTRLVPVSGSFRHADTPGANRFKFTGRIGGVALTPGNYLLQATPRGGDGKVGAAASSQFHIIR
jgi:hypothetical protein